ncbi:MAG: hypothetical protein M3Z22_03270 [Verrucomicrobiota bacterium]|nr:hypothetical protein [Verrucomicrobiota bacterium]
MAVDYVEFAGWKNNIRLANAHAELIITLDVGPRVISYRTHDSGNIFKTFDEQLGGTGEPEWKSRGGHRFWLAPEDAVLSYIPDNSSVQHRVMSDLSVEVENAPSDQLPIRKSLTLSLDRDSTRVTVTHRAENHGSQRLPVATWGLSVMRAGGIEIIPLPALGEHPRDLLPTRPMVLWAFTDMSDTRWQWGRRFITLRQANAGPTKLGLTHKEHWIAYHRDDSLFVKTIEFDPAAVYPDFGCNFETFTNEEMLEVEALGPLVQLAPGEATEHTEQWELFEGVTAPPADEHALAAWAASEVRLPA